MCVCGVRYDPLTHRLCPMCILSSHAKRGLVVMMNFVDVLVNSTMMEQLVHEIMPSVFDHEAANQMAY